MAENRQAGADYDEIGRSILEAICESETCVEHPELTPYMVRTGEAALLSCDLGGDLSSEVVARVFVAMAEADFWGRIPEMKIKIDEKLFNEWNIMADQIRFMGTIIQNDNIEVSREQALEWINVTGNTLKEFVNLYAKVTKILLP